MSQEEPVSEKQIMRQCVGYTLIGFGFPSGFCGFMLLRLVFLPARNGHVMAPFRFDHPAFVMGAILLMIGALLLGTGLLFVRSARSLS